LARFERARRRRRSVIGLVGAAGAAVLTGCTELAPGSDTLNQGVGMNLPEAGVADPRWACLDEPPPGAAARVVPSVELTLVITDVVMRAAPAGLQGRACAKADVRCETPLTPSVGLADDNALHLSVPQGFDGFVELTSPSTVSTLYFLNRELMRDSTEALTVVTTVALAGLAAEGNVVLDPTLGHLLLRTFDCTGEPAAGVRLMTDAGGKPFAFVDGLPNIDLQVTTTDGVGGFVNVPLGYAVVEGYRVDGERLLGRTNVVVRQGWFTYGDVEPRPQ
jgi:hypothetical protein